MSNQNTIYDAPIDQNNLINNNNQIEDNKLIHQNNHSNNSRALIPVEGADAVGGASPGSASNASTNNYSVPRPVPYVGLVNPSCICYLNSLLQTLYHTPAFRSAVFQANTSQDAMDDTPKALQNLFYSLGTSKEAQNSKLLTQSFGWGPRDYAVQHDIQELFAKLREEVESRLHGAVDTLFTTLGENFIRLLDNSYSSGNVDMNHELILPVQNQKSVETSLDGHCAVDRLDGTNKYKLEREGRPAEYVDAEKGYRFLRFAPVFFIHLKRFEFDYTSENMELKKINTCFEFPKVLDLSQRENKTFVTQNHIDRVPEYEKNQRTALQVAMKQQEIFPECYGLDPEHPEAVYDLYGVLVHSGGVHHGHYTCNIRDVDKVQNPDGSESYQLANRWYNYDDHVVSEISEENAVDKNFGGYTFVRGHQYLSSKNAYMLAYVRRSLVPRLFKNDDPRGEKTLPESVRKEFDAKIDEENRLQRIELEKNRQCQITLITDDVIAENVRIKQVELLENGDNIPQDAAIRFQIGKSATIDQVYNAVSQLMKLPVEDFRLHWFQPCGNYETKFRVGNPLVFNSPEKQRQVEAEIAKKREAKANGNNNNNNNDNDIPDSNLDTLESRTPRWAQLPERPWSFKLYIQRKVILPFYTQTNAARFCTFRVSSNTDGLNTMADPSPAQPFVDNRMFQFDAVDNINPKVELTFDKVHSIEAVSFQCPLPKDHPAGYACTRYDVRITIYNGENLVHTHIAEHRSHTDHSIFHSDNRFCGPDNNTRAKGPFKGNRVLIERVNPVVFDHFYPGHKTDPKLSDQWILSRLKIQVPASELPQTNPVVENPRFISDDIRVFHMAVKFYSYRTGRIDFCGFVPIPISEWVDNNFNVLRYVCGLEPSTKIRLYEESNGEAELVETYRKHLQVRKRDDVVENILIVQEEPPAGTNFIYDLPFVSSYLRSIAGTRTIMLFSFKNPLEMTNIMLTVPEYATHDMVCEEVGKAVNVAWDRIRLYGNREGGYGSRNMTMPPLPRPEPFRSDESNIRSMLDGRREGIIFFDVLKCSLKEAESVMEVTCHFSDSLGNRVSDKPFHQEVSVSLTMTDLAEMILDHFGFPYETPHVFIDLQQNMLENYAIVVPQSAEKRGAVPTPVAGATNQGNASVWNHKNIQKFFRSFENRIFEIRPFPEADSLSQVYVVSHGEYHQNSYPSVHNRAVPPPAFLSMPLSADVNDAKQIVMDKLKMPDEEFQKDPENHELMLYIHNALHFPNWETKLKDYFFHNPSELSRPKALLVCHKFEKEKPGSKYVPSTAPTLSLKKKNPTTTTQAGGDGK